MPNWCDTQITIFDENVNDLKKLYEDIQKWTSKEYSKSDFGNEWLGNVVIGSGIATYNEEKRTWTPNVSCRGSIVSLQFSEEEGLIFICQEDAWSPNYEIWKAILEKYLPTAQLIVTAVEPGCEIYESNDPNIERTYNIDVCQDDEYPELNDFDCEWSVDEDDCISILKDMLAEKSIALDDNATIDNYIAKVQEVYSNNVLVHQFDSMDV